MAFSRDLKDFVAAFQAGYKMIPSQTEKEYEKAKLEYQKALTRKMNAEDPGLDSELKRAQIDATKALAEHRRNPQATGYKGRYALEPLDEDQQAEVDKIETPTVPEDPDVPEFAHGGAVPITRGGNPMDWRQMQQQTQPRPRMAGGGISLDSMISQRTRSEMPWNQQPAAPTPQYRPRTAIPHYADGGVVEEDQAAPAEEEKLPQGFSYTAVKDAVKGGYESLSEQFKLNGAVDSPAAGRAKEAMQKGIGAIDPTQLAEVDKAAGLENMPEDRRNMARLAALWEFYQKQGMPNRAKAASADLLQTYRMIHNRYDAIAKAAAEEGDVDGAVDAALRAYSYIPDGKTIKIKKTDKGYAYSYTDDETGKVVAKAILSPDEILAAVTNHGMDSFDDLVMASGDKDEIGKLREDRQAKRAETREYNSEKRAVRAENRKKMGAVEYDEDGNPVGSAEFSKEKPAQIESVEQFDELPIGAWFTNPKDGKVIKKTKERFAAPSGE
jgi:hypothetical protein